MSIRRLAGKIVKECNIGASLSKMETLFRQLGQLAEDKLGDCQGENTLYQGLGQGIKLPLKTFCGIMASGFHTGFLAGRGKRLIEGGLRVLSLKNF